MKKVILSLVLLTLFILNGASQPSFGGSIKTSLIYNIAFPYEEDRFDNLINPGNFLDIHDIQLTNYFTGKIEGADETSSFSLWITLNTYQIAKALEAAAYDDEKQTLVVNETLPFLGTQFTTISLLRAYISFYVNDILSFTFGRLQMHTGYGYGWNPVDFTNPLKNPYDPDAELRGVDAVKATISFGNVFAASASGVYTGEGVETGLDVKSIMLSGETTLWLPGIEIIMNGLYEYDESRSEDRIPSAIGAGCKFNLFDIGIYGEGALRFGSRNIYYNFSRNTFLKTDMLFSALAGIEYVFPNELMAVVEYFYNGEGMSDIEKDDFRQSVQEVINMSGYPSSQQLLSIIPGYLNKHYILCNLTLPLYDLDMDMQLLALFSPDGLMLNLMPSLSFQLTGSLTVSVGYTGLFDLSDNGLNEASLSPVKYMTDVTVWYYY